MILVVIPSFPSMLGQFEIYLKLYLFQLSQIPNWSRSLSFKLTLKIGGFIAVNALNLQHAIMLARDFRREMLSSVVTNWGILVSNHQFGSSSAPRASVQSVPALDWQQPQRVGRRLSLSGVEGVAFSNYHDLLWDANPPLDKAVRKANTRC